MKNCTYYLISAIANTGFVTISTANSNLDGTGTTALLLTAGNNGTLVKTLIIKAQNNTCFLYTSDAADERSSVDFGGCRIIKKKK